MGFLIMKEFEVSKLLIVESSADKFFIEALLTHINLNIEVGEPLCLVDDYECIGGMGNLEQKLKFVLTNINKGKVDKVGIIFDADSMGIEKREEEIKEKIISVFNKYDEDIFSIYIMNRDGFGELEDILKEIKTTDSLYADCLDNWRECLSKNKIEVSDKIFNKFWINNYVMYDTCISSKHRGKKDKYCIFEYAMKNKDIWNFDHKILNDLKKFLKELGE